MGVGIFALLFFFLFFWGGFGQGRDISFVTTKERNSFIEIMSGIYCKWQSQKKKVRRSPGVCDTDQSDT